MKLTVTENKIDPANTEAVCLEPWFLEKITSKIFPDTECITVNWVGGTSGAALTSLVGYFLYNDMPEYRVSSEGNSHDSLNQQCFNWLKSSHNGPGFPNGHVTNFIGHQHYVEPADPNRPLLLFSHHETDYDKYFRRWPKGSIIKITTRFCDRHETLLNSIRKINYQNWNPKTNYEWWEQWKLARPDLFLKYSSPLDVTVEDLRSYILNAPSGATIEELRKKNYQPNRQTDYFEYGQTESIPKQYQSRVLDIPYYNLVRNPEWVLETLSAFLNRPVNDAVKNAYQLYLDKHNSMISKWAPWLREEGPWNQPL